MLQLAWKNILFRRMRALLTVLGIASSISLVLLMSGIMTGTERSFLDSFRHMGGEVRVQAKSDALKGLSIDTTPAGRLLSRQTVDQIMRTATGYDASASSGVVVQTLMPPASPNQPDRMTLNGVEPGRESVALRGVAIARGEAKLAGDHEIILGARAAQELTDLLGHPVQVGEQVALPNMSGTFTVKAITEPRDTFTDVLVVTPLRTAQEAFQRGDTVNFLVLAYPVDQVKTVAPVLKEQFPEYEIVTAEAMLSSVDKALQGQRSFFQMINTTVYFTAVAILFMVMYTAVMERTREIGTMRAVGAPRSAIVGGLLAEAALITLVGALLASLPAWYLIHDWGFLTLSEFSLEAVKAIGAALVVALVSCLYPAVRAARINPLEALRYE